MTNEHDIAEIMKSARDRITSENAVPVTVARMPAEEVAALLDEIAALRADAERYRSALSCVTSDLFYQIESKHGPRAASEYPSIIEARAAMKNGA